MLRGGLHRRDDALHDEPRLGAIQTERVDVERLDLTVQALPGLQEYGHRRSGFPKLIQEFILEFLIVSHRFEPMQPGMEREPLAIARNMRATAMRMSEYTVCECGTRRPARAVR